MPKTRLHLKQLLSSHRFWIAVAVLVSIVCYYLSSSKLIFDRLALAKYLRTLGIWSPVIFSSIYAVSMVIGAPTVIFTIAGGAVFGLLWGTIYSIIGATLGAMGAFWLSRYLLRESIDRRFGNRPTLQKFKMGIATHSLQFVLMVRLIPITPFNVENYLFGLTDIDWKTYLIGTAIGIIPGTIAYTWVGETGATTLAGGSYVSFLMAIGFLCLLSSSPMLISWWRNRSSS